MAHLKKARLFIKNLKLFLLLKFAPFQCVRFKIVEFLECSKVILGLGFT